MNIQKVIEQLGYKRSEAQFYLAALSLGESKISQLAEKLKIPRTSAIMIAERLQKDGLISYYVKRTSKYWVAENPDKLMVKLKHLEASLQEVLPALKAIEMKHVSNIKTQVKVYVGAKEIKLIFADIILTKNNFRAVVAWNDLVHILGAPYLQEFIDMQVGHFLKMQLLTPACEAGHTLRSYDSKELRETRFLSRHARSINTATFIYGNKIAIISLAGTLPTGFLIEDVCARDTMSAFFEELWSNQAN